MTESIKADKLYFCKTDDMEKNPDTPIYEAKLVSEESVPLDSLPSGHYSVATKGFELTGTCVVESSKTMKELLSRLVHEKHRMPRRRKKQLMNKVFKDRTHIYKIMNLIPESVHYAQYYIREIMFPGRSSYVVSDSEHYIVRLCIKRTFKELRQDLRKGLKQVLAKLEQNIV